MLEHCPFELIEVSGDEALMTWESLKGAGRGVPVVLGDDLDRLFEPFHPMERERLVQVEEILAQAAAISFPDDLRKLRREEHARAMEFLKETNPRLGLDEEDVKSSFAKVKIALIPTDDPTTIPAHLRWGHWNDCPPPAHHVAALRLWRDLYGAELVGISGDVINLRVKRKPATREEALALARLQHLYCSDIIDQGVGSYRALATELMAHHWWFFWWD
jgi:hypothetical protein